MKKAGFFAVAAASSAALAAGSTVPPTEGSGVRGKEAGSSGSPRKGAEKGEFTPRFDGLRFIETLVTAHR